MKSTADTFKYLAMRIKKTLWVLGLHAFLLILILIFLDLIIGVFVFYNYVSLAEQEQPQATGSIIRFDNKAYQDVLGELQAKDIRYLIVNQPGSTE